jgi:hypothetical protein
MFIVGIVPNPLIQTAELPIVKAGGAYSYHSTVEV